MENFHSILFFRKKCETDYRSDQKRQRRHKRPSRFFSPSFTNFQHFSLNLSSSPRSKENSPYKKWGHTYASAAQLLLLVPRSVLAPHIRLEKNTLEISDPGPEASGQPQEPRLVPTARTEFYRFSEEPPPNTKKRRILLSGSVWSGWCWFYNT